MRFLLLAAFLLSISSAAGARVLRVGPGQPYRLPSTAAAVTEDGDTVEIQAGDYRGDAAVWRQNDLTLRGVGGYARLFADGAHAEGKAIWVVKGANVTIERVQFSGARVRERNGAGIRAEGSGLTLRHTRFVDNENGILAGRNPTSEIVIEDSEFIRNGAGDGQTHNIYIGHVKRFVLRRSYVHHARVGHNVKSRAAETVIENCRIADEEDGNSSYGLEFPHGGRVRLEGNRIQQGPMTENPTLVSFGAEGLVYGENELVLENNTLVNDRPGGGTFVAVWGKAVEVRMRGNRLVGTGTELARKEAIVPGARLPVVP